MFLKFSVNIINVKFINLHKYVNNKNIATGKGRINDGRQKNFTQF